MPFLASVYNTVVLADTNFLAANLIPQDLPCYIRLTVAVSAGVTPRLILVRNAVTYTLDLKDIDGATTLVAERLHVLEFPMHQTSGAATAQETFNFQINGAGATIRKFVVEELHGYRGV